MALQRIAVDGNLASWSRLVGVVILTVPISARSVVLSFFDEGDEPRTRVFEEPEQPRPRAPRPRRTGAGPPGGPVDDQTLLVRRAVAGVIGLVLLIVIVLGIRSCV